MKEMTGKAPHTGGNGLLHALPPGQRERVEQYASRVTLKEGKVIALAEHHVSHVYFPISAVLSVLSVTTNRVGIETAVVGHEGMAPMAPFHHVDSAAEQVIVQVPGEALVIPRERFHQALAEAPALRERLHRYAQALFTFAAQSSACNRQHSIVQRCARWLLTTHDRVPGDEFYLTHQFLSQMLGVRRSSVTVAAEALRNAGAIEYTRGRVKIVNRTLLLERGCECYAIVRSTYDRLLSGRDTRSPLEGVELAAGDESLVGSGSAEDHGLTADAAPINPPEESLADFSMRLRQARERSEAWGEAAIAVRPSDAARLARLAEELSIALEQLGVAEEEMRAQMAALTEARYALENQQALWRARFNGLPDAFIETDQDDTIVEVNRAAEVLIGRGRERVIGKPITTLFPDTERRGVRDVIHRLRSGETTAHLRAPLIGRSDARPHVDVSVATSRSGGGMPMGNGRGYAGARWLLRPERQEHAN